MNRYSSVLLLFGASVYVVYRLSEFSPRMQRISKKFWQLLGCDVNRLEPVFFSNANNTNSVQFNENRLRNSCHWDMDDVPDLDLPLPKTPITPFTPFWNQLDINLNYNVINDRCSANFGPSRNGTVAKIDEVLTQIDDIKKSIVEIDSQIFDFSGSKCTSFNPAFLTLTNTDLNEESDDLFDRELESEQTPTTPSTPLQELNLEWDVSDVETDSLYYGSEELDIESALSLPVTDIEKQKFKSMQELLEDAKQLGLLNTILDAISAKVYEDKSRDSAYFED